MKTKSIIIYLTGLSSSGGKERVVANLLREWNNLYSLCLITKDTKDSFYDIPREIERISLKTPFLDSMFNMRKNRILRMVYFLLNMEISIIKLRMILRKRNYDYLYVTTPLNAYEAFYAMDDPGNRLVISEHASINAYNSIYKKMKQRIYPKAYCISVPNRLDTDEYNKWGCNSLYIPHPISFIVQESIEKKEKIVLNVGRLTPDKQQTTLVRIWNSVSKEARRGWKLWIVGSGEDKEIISELIQKIDDHSIEMIPATKNIADIYRKAKIFAFTSKTEGFGMVLLEAMAFGIPCISFDCPSGPRDVIIDGINGFLISNGDVEGYRKKLQDILLLPDDEIEYLIDGAYKTVRDWRTETIISRWKEVFK